jgi:acid stress chaperone HdeB
MKTPAIAIMASCLAAFVPMVALAQVTLDVSKISCEQFVTYKVADPQHIAIWISGYYHGTRGDPILDTQGMAKNTTKLQDYCFKHSATPLAEAVKAVFGPGE